MDTDNNVAKVAGRLGAGRKGGENGGTCNSINNFLKRRKNKYKVFFKKRRVSGLQISLLELVDELCSDKWSSSQRDHRTGFLGLPSWGAEAEEVTEVDYTLASLLAAGWSCSGDTFLYY